MQYYKDNWDTYWAEIQQNDTFAPWDIASEASIEADRQAMAPYFQSSQLLLDLGCGTGIEAFALSRYFDKVVGVDVSSEVISQANSTYPQSNVEFQQLDGLDSNQVKDFIQKHGHTNIYMRGVLQQIQISDRELFLENLHLLMGDHGYLFFKEISTEAKSYFQKIIFEKRRLPSQLHRVLIQQVTKLVGLNIADISDIFTPPQFQVVESGETYIELFFDEETTLHVPATYGIIKT